MKDPQKDPASGARLCAALAAQRDALEAQRAALLGALKSLVSAMRPHLIDTEGDDGRDLADSLEYARAAIRAAEDGGLVTRPKGGE